MQKLALFFVFLLVSGLLLAQEEVGAFTQDELAVVAAIKAQNQTPQEPASTAETTAMQAPQNQTEETENTSEIKLSEQAKQTAWQEQQKPVIPSVKPR